MKKRYVTFVVLLILSILPILSLLHTGLPVTHDGQDHVARIANFYQSLREGNIAPRWANNLNWGFGHPVVMFLYPLPSYIASIFYFVGFSYIDSYKLVFALTYIVSILAMYLYARDVFGDKAGIAAAIMYGFAPYRFVNIFVRGAFGEHVAFIFLPLILWAMSALANGRFIGRWGSILAFSIAGLLLSHNAVSLMFIPVCIVYLMYLLFFEVKNTHKFVLTLVFFVGYGVALSAFFIIPAFFEGKYTLRDIVTKNEIAGRTVPLLAFVYSPWNFGGGNEFTKELGVPSLIFFCTALYIVFVHRTQKVRVLLVGSMLLLLLYIFLMSSYSLFIWNAFSILQKFQFPWRLLVITTFINSIIAAVVIRSLNTRYSTMVLGVIGIVAIVSTHTMWKPKEYKQYTENFFSQVYSGTTDTGESSPIWSVRFMEFRPEVPMEIAEGDAIVQSVFRNTTIRMYDVVNTTKSRLVENTLYFPGWTVFVDGKQTEVEFQDPQWRGRMTFWVDSGKHVVTILLKDTKVRTVSNLVSIVSVFGLIPLYLLAGRHEKKPRVIIGK